VRTALGATSKFPKWACAYKFESSEAETTLLAVEWNATRSGVVVPVYVFEAVQLAGTTVTRATGHNLGAYAKLGAKIGDTIVVTKSNDIIPEVVKVLK
jgi:DNA ligase (NAD+)